MAVAGLAQRLPRPATAFLLVCSAVLGLGQASRIWEERREVPVRAVAADLDALFEPDVVLHSLLAPPGWALESYRGHPVLDAGDLLQQPFGQYLDRLGSRGYLSRPQRLFVPVSALTKRWAQDLDTVVLPGSRPVERRGKAGLWRIYDLGPFLLDPGHSPYLLDKSLLLPGNEQRIGQEQRRRFVDRARKFLVLRLFEPGADILFLDGREGGFESFLGRRIRSAGEASLATRAILVAWPGTPWAGRLRALHGSKVEKVELEAAGNPAYALVWRP